MNLIKHYSINIDLNAIPFRHEQTLAPSRMNVPKLKQTHLEKNRLPHIFVRELLHNDILEVSHYRNAMFYQSFFPALSEDAFVFARLQSYDLVLSKFSYISLKTSGLEKSSENQTFVLRDSCASHASALRCNFDPSHSNYCSHAQPPTHAASLTHFRSPVQLC